LSEAFLSFVLIGLFSSRAAQLGLYELIFFWNGIGPLKPWPGRAWSAKYLNPLVTRKFCAIGS
jgi:hypothetical protein